jgi:predicted Zn finger-like uncharacterized protein
MILTCPSCGTQYVVKDGAIPPEGRQVRCAACKHSWHQEPEGEQPLELQDEVETAPPSETVEESYDQAEPEAAERASYESGAQPSRDEEESFAEAALIEPRSGPEAEERAYEEAVIEGEADPEPALGGPAPSAAPEQPVATEDWNAPPEAEPESDAFSPFAGEDDEEPRRGSGLTKVLIVALVIVALAVAFWFLAPPDMKSRLGLAAAGASPLQVSNPPHVERLQLASGNELLTVSGRVINPTAREQVVPPLNAKLTNQSGKLVYSWTIAPPTRSLAAGASASFNSAEVNVPPGGEYLTITLGQKA